MALRYVLCVNVSWLRPHSTMTASMVNCKARGMAGCQIHVKGFAFVAHMTKLNYSTVLHWYL